MKILHIAQMVKGGVASHLCEAIPAQVEQFGEANIIVLVAADQVPFLPSIPKASLRTFQSSRRSPSAFLDMAATARRLIREERPDLVHLHSTFAGAVIRLSYLASFRRRPPTIYCAHGWSFNMRVGRLKRACYGLLERLLAPLADAIPCISEYEIRTARERGLPTSRLHLVYNGIQAEIATPVAASVTFDPERLNLLFIGRQDLQKGFDTLAQAMRLLEGKPIQLHAVGASVVSQSAPGAEVQDNIVQHGWQARECIPGFIAAADAVIMPSRWEGFGLVAIEAMRQGRAVLASDVDALPELVRPGVSGMLFPAEDPEAMAKLIASLDRQSLRSLGETAQTYFIENFTADRMNDSLMRLYSTILNR